MGECSIRGLLLEKRKIYTQKKLNKIYTGKIHVIAKMYKAEYTALMGLLPDRACIIL